MQAIRCARAVTGRDVIVRFQGSYHGIGSGNRLRQAGHHDAEREAVIVLPQGDRSSLRELFDTSGTKIAAVLIDLMPNRAGFQPAEPEFVNAVRQLTARNGSLMIVDEVITFRLALSGLSPTYGITPDLATFGKLIGGGLPLSAPLLDAPTSWPHLTPRAVRKSRGEAHSAPTR
jgi:glutamate-1-semialdehyde 2,1-aminomutase